MSQKIIRAKCLYNFDIFYISLKKNDCEWRQSLLVMQPTKTRLDWKWGLGLRPLPVTCLHRRHSPRQGAARHSHRVNGRQVRVIRGQEELLVLNGRNVSLLGLVFLNNFCFRAILQNVEQFFGQCCSENIESIPYVVKSLPPYFSSPRQQFFANKSLRWQGVHIAIVYLLVNRNLPGGNQNLMLGLSVRNLSTQYPTKKNVFVFLRFFFGYYKLRFKMEFFSTWAQTMHYCAMCFNTGFGLGTTLGSTYKLRLEVGGGQMWAFYLVKKLCVDWELSENFE